MGLGFGLLNLTRGRVRWGIFYLEILLGVRRQMRLIRSRESTGPRKSGYKQLINEIRL